MKYEILEERSKSRKMQGFRLVFTNSKVIQRKEQLFYGALLCLFAFDNHHMSFVEGRNSQMPENVEDIENGKGYGW